MLRNLTIVGAAIIIGVVLAVITMGSLNGQGSSAGFAGLGLVFIVAPLVIVVSIVSALITYGRAISIYFMATVVAALSFMAMALFG